MVLWSQRELSDVAPKTSMCWTKTYPCLDHRPLVRHHFQLLLPAHSWTQSGQRMYLEAEEILQSGCKVSLSFCKPLTKKWVSIPDCRFFPCFLKGKLDFVLLLEGCLCVLCTATCCLAFFYALSFLHRTLGSLGQYLRTPLFLSFCGTVKIWTTTVWGMCIYFEQLSKGNLCPQQIE